MYRIGDLINKIADFIDKIGDLMRKVANRIDNISIPKRPQDDAVLRGVRLSNDEPMAFVSAGSLPKRFWSESHPQSMFRAALQCTTLGFLKVDRKHEQQSQRG